MATVTNNLGELAFAQKRYSDAERLYSRALQIRRSLLGEDHPDVAVVLSNLAATFDKLNRYADAQPLLKEALAIDERSLGPKSAVVAQDLETLASFYRDRGTVSGEPAPQRATETALRAHEPSVAGETVRVSHANVCKCSELRPGDTSEPDQFSRDSVPR